MLQQLCMCVGAWLAAGGGAGVTFKLFQFDIYNL